MNESVIAIIVGHINSHLKTSKVTNYGNFSHKEPVSHIRCRDGTTMSVQASEHCYCRPRNNNGPWTHVEVMISTKPIYFDKGDDDVAGYVPIENVAKEILARGNLVLTQF